MTVDTCHYMFVQTHRLCDTKSQLQCKVWTLRLCQCSFISCYKGTTGGAANHGEGYACMGAGAYGKSVYFHSILMQT